MDLISNTSLISKNKDETPDYGFFYTKFIHPLISILGIVENTWILITFAAGTVQISKKTKIYYWIIGICDLNIACFNFVWLDLCDVFYHWSQGSFYFCFDIISDLSCTITFLWRTEAIHITNYTLVGLSIERLTAIFWPLQAKSILTMNVTLWLLIFLNLPASILYTVNIILAASVKHIAKGRFMEFICLIDEFTTSGVLHNISVVIFSFFFHTIIDLVVVSIICFKLHISQRNRNLLSKGKQSSKEVESTLTLLFLCIINLLMYGSCLILTLISLLKSWIIMLDAILFHVTIIFTLLISSITVPHSLNIFVYAAFIPSFRRAALCKGYHVSHANSTTLTAKHRVSHN